MKNRVMAFGASYSQEEGMAIEEMARRLEATTGRWVIGAFAESELAGVIGFVRDNGEKSRHKGFIWGMYVMPTARGKGIGRALLEKALSLIDVLQGLRVVRLSVVTSNRVALALYKKCGFRSYGGEAEVLYLNGTFHSEFHMARKIGEKRNLDVTSKSVPCL